MLKMLLLVIAWLPLTVFAQPAPSPTPPLNGAVLTSPDAPRLQGIWKSTQPEKIQGGIYMTQEIRFMSGRWERVRFFSPTSDMKKVMLIERSEGPFDLKANPAGAPNPWLLNLKVSTHVLNLQKMHAGVSKALSIGSCRLNQKRETDISGGCGVFQSRAKCPVEYQLAATTKDGQLSMAQTAQTAGLGSLETTCEESTRAAALGPALKRVN